MRVKGKSRGSSIVVHVLGPDKLRRPGCGQGPTHLVAQTEEAH